MVASKFILDLVQAHSNAEDHSHFVDTSQTLLDALWADWFWMYRGTLKPDLHRMAKEAFPLSSAYSSNHPLDSEREFISAYAKFWVVADNIVRNNDYSYRKSFKLNAIAHSCLRAGARSLRGTGPFVCKAIDSVHSALFAMKSWSCKEESQARVVLLTIANFAHITPFVEMMGKRLPVDEVLSSEFRIVSEFLSVATFFESEGFSDSFNSYRHPEVDVDLVREELEEAGYSV